jgi:hypothetical protein
VRRRTSGYAFEPWKPGRTRCALSTTRSGAEVRFQALLAKLFANRSSELHRLLNHPLAASVAYNTNGASESH